MTSSRIESLYCILRRRRNCEDLLMSSSPSAQPVQRFSKRCQGWRQGMTILHSLQVIPNNENCVQFLLTTEFIPITPPLLYSFVHLADRTSIIQQRSFFRFTERWGINSVCSVKRPFYPNAKIKDTVARRA